MKEFFIIGILIIQFISCDNKGEFAEHLQEKDTNEIKLSKLLIYDAGGPEYQPFILLKADNNSITKYNYDENLLLKDSTIINGDEFKENYSFIINQIPNDFLARNGGEFSSPVDNSGLIFEIFLENGTINKWGVFIRDYQYKNDMQSYIEKFISSGLLNNY